MMLSIIRNLVQSGKWRLSQHALQEMFNDDISATEISAGVNKAIVVEDYPNANRGPTVLTLQPDRLNRPIHVVWGMKAGKMDTVTVITVYRPDPNQWSPDFRERLL